MKKTRILPLGFTLIEIMIVVAIIGILAAIAIANYTGAQARARDEKRKSDLREIQNALELYKQDYGHYPCSDSTVGIPGRIAGWQWSESGGTWIADKPGTNCGGGSLTPSYIQRLPLDPQNIGTDGPMGGPNNFSYAYLSINGVSSTCATAGQYYILITDLENANDSDPHMNKNIHALGNTVCSEWYTANTVWTIWNSNTYILSSPQ